MNKRLKHIIAATLVISAFTAIAPANINIGATKAYASSSIDEDDFDDLVVNKGSKELQLYDDSKCKDNDETDFDYDHKSYYIDLSGSNKEINIEADVDNDYEAYVFKDNKDKAYDLGDDIKVSSGTTLYVRIYEDGEFDEDDVKDNVERTYKIYIKGSSNSDDNDDDIYLEDITLSEGEINFKEKTSSYDIKVPESVDSIKIKAEPEDEDDTVEIDGYDVDEDDKYRREVDLKKGNNVIKINVEDDDDNKRTYTLNINRSTTSNSPTTTTKPGNNTNIPAPGNSSNAKCEQWVKVNGNWQYNDATGNAVKNKWHNDKTSGNWYYLDATGNMVTGWLNNSGVWYYLDGSGAIKTGWLKDGDKWYFMQQSGVMKSNGWIIDNGKYYYLSSSGTMLSNVTINGYKLGSDGAWIRR